MEGGNFRLFAANEKCKWQTFIGLLQMETTEFVFLGWRRINGNR
jgi:hypothetical protein